LRLSDLRLACERLLGKAEAEFGPEVGLDSVRVDEYWSVDPVSAYALAAEPQFEMGSVADDLENLGELLSRSDGELYLWHDLGHICGLLRVLAYLDSPSRDRGADQKVQEP
jgi:hypothetical protein